MASLERQTQLLVHPPNLRMQGVSASLREQDDESVQVVAIGGANFDPVLGHDEQTEQVLDLLHSDQHYNSSSATSATGTSQQQEDAFLAEELAEHAALLEKVQAFVQHEREREIEALRLAKEAEIAALQAEIVELRGDGESGQGHVPSSLCPGDGVPGRQSFTSSTSNNVPISAVKPSACSSSSASSSSVIKATSTTPWTHSSTGSSPVMQLQPHINALHSRILELEAVLKQGGQSLNPSPVRAEALDFDVGQEAGSRRTSGGGGGISSSSSNSCSSSGATSSTGPLGRLPEAPSKIEEGANRSSTYREDHRGGTTTLVPLRTASNGAVDPEQAREDSIAIKREDTEVASSSSCEQRTIVETPTILGQQQLQRSLDGNNILLREETIQGLVRENAELLAKLEEVFAEKRQLLEVTDSSFGKRDDLMTELQIFRAERADMQQKYSSLCEEMDRLRHTNQALAEQLFAATSPGVTSGSGSGCAVGMLDLAGGGGGRGP
ncbi:unnamed protein product [Amoebophrya sp. A25]|nr:unnamed protein product [Amoebophrya sp. A25]|eukprot:GSA25T00023157001.1